jgi:predicted CXXCH cytochrome family protein
MKRTITKGALVLILGLGVAATAFAYNGTYNPNTGINATPHDMSSKGLNGSSYAPNPSDPQDRICVYCHAPHNTYKLSPANGGPGAAVGAPNSGPAAQAPDAFDYLPLWNHALTPNYASYTMYQNGPGAPTVGAKASQAILNGMTPGSGSLLCLSCHDGSVAVNSYGNLAQLSVSGGGSVIGTAFQIGKDAYLGNHHPIGFDYDAVRAGALGDTEIRSADTAQLGGAGAVRNHLFGTGNSRMECGTCHSVHNKGNTGERLLWRSDTQSRLCLTCHDKGTDPGTTP